MFLRLMFTELVEREEWGPEGTSISFVDGLDLVN